MASERLKVLAVYAHPDDECYCSGGTLAKYIADGAEAMVVSATRGQAGEINDAERASRATLGQVREQELHASCQALGVQHVRCLDYMDGGLADADYEQLVDDVVCIIRDFKPDVIITFGDDGAYGHPDHITIGKATTHALFLAADPDYQNQRPMHQVKRLYYAHFPENNFMLVDAISEWLMSLEERFTGTSEYALGLALFARESTMLQYSRDHVETKWYPPGFTIVEQGEIGNELFIILSGTVIVRHENEDGTHEKLNEIQAGGYFGEVGAATHSNRTASVIAKNSVTCLVFSPAERTNYAGRGVDAILEQHSDDDVTTDYSNVGDATHVIDIRKFISHKVASIASHRTQTPITPDIFPMQMFKQLFGYEYFVQAYPEIQLKTELL